MSALPIYASRITLSDAKALLCDSSSEAKIQDIIDITVLPKAFQQDNFKQFRVATIKGNKKITIDVKTGQWLSGNKEDWPLYTYPELVALGDIPKAKHIQFVPEGTPFSVLDFDSDKSKSDEHRQRQVNYIQKKLNQFDGIIELSTGGLGLHAYLEDRDVKELGIDIAKANKNFDKAGLFSFEVFSGKSPIVLTGNIISEANVATGMDALPKNIMDLIKKNYSDAAISSEPALSTPSASTKKEIVDTDTDTGNIDAITKRFKEIDKKENRFDLGYKDTDVDLSQVDYSMAHMLLKASYGDIDVSKLLLCTWMTRYRPDSSKPITAKEIDNKSKRAVDNAYAKVNDEQKEQWKQQAQKEKNSTGSIKELMMKKGQAAAAILKAAVKSRSIAWDLVYEGTMNTFFANSGAGKTKIAVVIAIHIAKNHSNKLVYYYAPDLSMDDLLEMRALVEENNLENFIIDQDSRGEEFIDMLDRYGQSDDIGDVVFIVDTIKKVFPVNDKPKAEKGFAILRRCISRGATGIAVAHTLKDGITLAGVAEFAQDVDNVLWVEKQYIGEDKLKSTIMPSPDHRCRSRITPKTFMFNRDGFDYEIVEDAVDNGAASYAIKHEKEKGNLTVIATEIVEEYFEKKEELPKSKLFEELRHADTYTGTKTTGKLKDLIDTLAEEGFIHFEKKGRTNLCLPREESEVLKLISKVSDQPEETSTKRENEEK